MLYRIVTEESCPYAIALGFASTTTTVVVILALVHLYFVVKYITDETVRSDMYWIVLMCPITTLCGLIGMFVPRSATFLNAVALAYLMLCLFVMVTLMNSLFGGRQSLSAYLTERREVIRVNVFPICCCKCLPTFRPTETNLRRIEWTVFQTPLIRMCLEIMNMVVFLELNHRNHWWFQVSNVLGLSSMFLAFYGCYVMTPLGNVRLAQYKFKTIFRLVDIAQALFSFQKFFFDFLAAIGFFEEGPILPSLGKSQFITSSMLSWEMLLISIMATYLLRPSRNSVFDKYHKPNSATPTPQSGSTPQMTDLPPVRPPPCMKHSESDRLSLPAVSDSPSPFKKTRIAPSRDDSVI
uniref:Organic solute transporter alpha-like protein 3 n=1 Tax=Steinernema glaseri TaxID=37863 RepID=A0A1I7ZNW1_9BILA